MFIIPCAEDAARSAAAAEALAAVVAAAGWNTLQGDESSSEPRGTPDSDDGCFDAGGLPTAAHFAELAAAPLATQRALLRWALLAALRGGGLGSEGSPAMAVLLTAAGGAAGDAAQNDGRVRPWAQAVAVVVPFGGIKG